MHLPATLLAGYPAAVCLLKDARDEAWMQSVAPDFATLRKLPVRSGTVRIRINGSRVGLFGRAITVWMVNLSTSDLIHR